MAKAQIVLGEVGMNVAQTDLWTNASPTTAISAQTDITLSDSLSNYDYIKVDYATYTNSSAKECSLVISVDDFQKGTLSANSPLLSLCSLNAQVDGSYSRALIYKNETTITIDKAYQDGSASNNGNFSIPLKIIGLKGLTL